MRNERGAGRKPQITSEQLNEINLRVEKGETIASLAREYGVSRQALHTRLRRMENSEPIRLDYLVDGVCTTQIWIDVQNKKVSIDNLTDRLSACAFGICKSPTWEEFITFLENIYLQRQEIKFDEFTGERVVLLQERNETLSLSELLELTSSQLRLADENKKDKLPVFRISKQELLYFRTDTDGFQCKALSKDRKWFIKAQAVISGVTMNDWQVEVIASELCEQLGISHVEQHPCRVVYGGKTYNGVYSKNFELDGYEFISFERLLTQLGLSTYDKEFIHEDAIGKLEWCAEKLAQVGKLSYEDTLKYMIDLALIDCLVGNVDRHTRNFGLFYDSIGKRYKVALAFDNGMGLFEHDPYRDEYADFEAAMRNVYVSPYGEDPFDMLKLLHEKYDLKHLYPELASIRYSRNGLKPLANEYIDKMLVAIDAL